jgi:hypothetical protein
VLVPPEELEVVLDAGYKHEFEPTDVLRLCGLFRVNIRPVLFALSKQWRISNRILLAAQWTGHPRRPEAVEFRAVRAAAPARFFIPPHQRITRLGLNALANTANRLRLDVGISKVLEPVDGADAVELSIRRKTDSPRVGIAKGNVRWRMVLRPTQYNFYLLAILHTEELEEVWPNAGLTRRRSHTAKWQDPDLNAHQ